MVARDLRVRSFNLVLRFPSHEVADGRVMHVQIGCYLLLSIPIFLYRINDFRIAFSFVCDNLFREYFIQVWPVHVPMTLGNFRNVLVSLDMGDQAFDKIVFSQNGLALDLLPDRSFADPPPDEFAVFRLSFRSCSAELAKNPIDGQASCGRFTAGCRAIAGPLPGFGSLNHSGSDRI
jgi:hypothetical protein